MKLMINVRFIVMISKLNNLRDPFKINGEYEIDYFNKCI